MDKELIVIGDRLLIQLDETEEKTEVGLILPQTVKDKDEVLRGYIIKTGPGIPLGDPSSLGDEPWNSKSESSPRYLPMEAKTGDYALFLRKAAVEIKYEGQKYFIASQSAVLLLIREEDDNLEGSDDPPLSFE